MTLAVAILGIQQYQLNRITETVSEIKQFITQTTEQVKFTEKDEACLARNIYYEAGV